MGMTGGSTDKTDGLRSRWRVNDIGSGLSSTLHYLFVSSLLWSSLGVFYIFYLLNNPNLNSNNSLGCQEDNEGSWGIRVFYGDSPFSLKPIEAMNIWYNKSASWSVANPILTCASVTDSGFPSNYVADPFLYAQILSAHQQSLGFKLELSKLVTLLEQWITLDNENYTGQRWRNVWH